MDYQHVSRHVDTIIAFTDYHVPHTCYLGWYLRAHAGQRHSNPTLPWLWPLLKDTDAKTQCNVRCKVGTQSLTRRMSHKRNTYWNAAARFACSLMPHLVAHKRSLCIYNTRAEICMFDNSCTHGHGCHHNGLHLCALVGVTCSTLVAEKIARGRSSNQYWGMGKEPL